MLQESKIKISAIDTVYIGR